MIARHFTGCVPQTLVPDPAAASGNGFRRTCFPVCQL